MLFVLCQVLKWDISEGNVRLVGGKSRLLGIARFMYSFIHYMSQYGVTTSRVRSEWAHLGAHLCLFPTYDPLYLARPIPSPHNFPKTRDTEIPRSGSRLVDFLSPWKLVLPYWWSVVVIVTESSTAVQEELRPIGQWKNDGTLRVFGKRNFSR